MFSAEKPVKDLSEKALILSIQKLGVHLAPLNSPVSGAWDVNEWVRVDVGRT